jgi:hypothetical protein
MISKGQYKCMSAGAHSHKYWLSWTCMQWNWVVTGWLHAHYPTGAILDCSRLASHRQHEWRRVNLNTDSRDPCDCCLGLFPTHSSRCSFHNINPAYAAALISFSTQFIPHQNLRTDYKEAMHMTLGKFFKLHVHSAMNQHWKPSLLLC